MTVQGGDVVTPKSRYAPKVAAIGRFKVYLVCGKGSHPWQLEVVVMLYGDTRSEPAFILGPYRTGAEAHQYWKVWQDEAKLEAHLTELLRVAEVALKDAACNYARLERLERAAT